jgi:hypothetical protein
MTKNPDAQISDFDFDAMALQIPASVDHLLIH